MYTYMCTLDIEGHIQEIIHVYELERKGERRNYASHLNSWHLVFKKFLSHYLTHAEECNRPVDSKIPTQAVLQGYTCPEAN